MSFYGQMRWDQFQQFFYKHLLTAVPFDKQDLFNDTISSGEYANIAPQTQAYIEPNEDFATLRINAANQWIRVSPIDSKGDQGTSFSGFHIFHGAPDTSTAKQYMIYKPLRDDEVEKDSAVQLTAGNFFVVTTPYVDAAGHITSQFGSTVYRLPDQLIQIAQAVWNPEIEDWEQDVRDLTLDINDQKFHFASDGFIKLMLNETCNLLSLEHISYHAEQIETQGIAFLGAATESYTAEKLNPGDFITTDKIVFDSCGHGYSIEKIYLQLPITDTDAKLEGISADLLTLQSEFALHVEEYNGLVTKQREDIDALFESTNKLQAFVHTDVLTGDIPSDIVGMRNALVAFMPEGMANGTETIAQTLAMSINQTRGRLEGIANQQDGTLRGLLARVTLLENVAREHGWTVPIPD